MGVVRTLKGERPEQGVLPLFPTLNFSHEFEPQGTFLKTPEKFS